MAGDDRRRLRLAFSPGAGLEFLRFRDPLDLSDSDCCDCCCCCGGGGCGGGARADTADALVDVLSCFFTAFRGALVVGLALLPTVLLLGNDAALAPAASLP